MLDIAAILAILVAMSLACTADKFRLKVTRTARTRVNTRLLDEWIMASPIIGIVYGANYSPHCHKAKRLITLA